MNSTMNIGVFTLRDCYYSEDEINPLLYLTDKYFISFPTLINRIETLNFKAHLKLPPCLPLKVIVSPLFFALLQCFAGAHGRIHKN